MGGTARVPSCRRRARVRAPAHVFASCFIVASWLRGIGAVTADDVDPFADANVDSRYGAFDHGTVERLLRSRLKLAGRFLEQSTFADASTRVSCTCSQYCEGQCFAPACARLVQRPCGRFQEGRTSALTPVHLEAACFVRRRTGRSLQRHAVRIARRACACFRKTHAAPLEAVRRARRIARRTCFRRSMLRMRALSTSRKTSAAKKATILRRMRVLLYSST